MSDAPESEILISDSVKVKPMPAFSPRQRDQVGKILVDLWLRHPNQTPYFDDMHVLFKAISVGLDALENDLKEKPKAWQPIKTAPKDGAMLDLWCTGGDFATDDADEYMTIGFNNFDNTGEDKWLMAGWCWVHDYFREGNGTPLMWKPRATPPEGSEG